MTRAGSRLVVVALADDRTFHVFVGPIDAWSTAAAWSELTGLLDDVVTFTPSVVAAEEGSFLLFTESTRQRAEEYRLVRVSP